VTKEELSSLFISVPEKLDSFFSSISKEKLKSYFTCAFIWVAFGGFLLERAFYARNFGFHTMVMDTSPMTAVFPYALYFVSRYVYRSTKSVRSAVLASVISFAVGICLVLGYPYMTQAMGELSGPAPDEVYLLESEDVAVDYAEAEYGGTWRVVRNSGITDVLSLGKSYAYDVTVSDGSVERTYTVYRDDGQMVVREL
jgi:hypothetical protein